MAKSILLDESVESQVAAEVTAPETPAVRLRPVFDLPAQIRKIWEDGKLRFEQGNGRPADPVQFAMTFVDRNFGRT